MIRFALILMACVTGVPAMAQTVVPVPRPTPEERAETAAAAAARAETASQAVLAEATRPLTDAEQQAFSQQIRTCWNVAEAEPVRVTVQFEMDDNAHPIPHSFALISADEAARETADLAFAAARRAVLRCAGETGYDLPSVAMPYWQRVQITFDPTDIAVDGETN
ncbi:hypothetical protein [Hasllibacter sp. MH4015]|uniref:hypothetical protein n=1 Tax=Hasllibacter sp. MH4015 TaxID=2854029 RepID=UPI001CD5F105|nr:hypothetical protein [Hasllibacter sp. MH4015]